MSIFIVSTLIIAIFIIVGMRVSLKFHDFVLNTWTIIATAILAGAAAIGHFLGGIGG